MVDNSKITLEDGKTYHVIDKIEIEGHNFVYLSNSDNPEEFCCRKEIEEESNTFLVGLDDQEEADLALKTFLEKNANE